MVSSLYLREVLHIGKDLLSFKPYFRWLAPYTFYADHDLQILKVVLNLILDG